MVYHGLSWFTISLPVKMLIWRASQPLWGNLVVYFFKHIFTLLHRCVWKWGLHGSTCYSRWFHRGILLRIPAVCSKNQRHKPSSRVYTLNGVSSNSGMPPIIRFDRIFPHKPSIWGYHHFRKPRNRWDWTHPQPAGHPCGRFFLNQAFPACEREDDEDVGCWKSDLPDHRLRNSKRMGWRDLFRQRLGWWENILGSEGVFKKWRTPKIIHPIALCLTLLLWPNHVGCMIFCIIGHVS